MNAVFLHSDDSDHQTLRVAISGDLDISCAEDLDGVLAAFQRSERPNMCLDISRVSFVDARGLRTFVELEELAERRGGILTLVGVARAVRRALTITGVDDLCRVVPLAPTLTLVRQQSH